MPPSILVRAARLPAQSALLLVSGLAVLTAGVLLIPVAAGVLAFFEDGLVGALLVLQAVLMLSLGHTPFGELAASRLTLPAGVCLAAVGIVACFVPDLLGAAPRLLLFACLSVGGAALLLQLLLNRRKLRTWLHHGGVLRPLAAACAAVYLLGMLFGVLALFPALLPGALAATAAVLYGAAIVLLALILRRVYLLFPEAEPSPGAQRTLPLDQAVLLLVGVLMLLLGALLVPVSFGALPFSGSAQLGLLMLVYAVQIVATGSTPMGVFPRSWPLVGAGLLFAVLGAASCTVPEVLVAVLGYVIGVFNVAGGAAMIARIAVRRLRTPAPVRAQQPPPLKRLFLIQLATNTLAIVFGLTVFLRGLLPTAVLGVVLAVNGCLLFYLLATIVTLDRLAVAAAAEPAT